jgi:hypothetical protein
MSWIGRVWSTMLAAAPLRMWALFASAPVLTLGTAALVVIVKSDKWPEALRGRQLEFLGWAMLGALALVGVVVVTLAAVRVKGTGPGGVSVEIDADDEAKVTVTQEPAA